MPDLPRELTIRDERRDDGSSVLRVKIEDDGTLTLEGYESGDAIKRTFGDFDYEYWLRVKPEFKDAVLLHLVRERFDLSSMFEQWLDDHGIPTDLQSF